MENDWISLRVCVITGIVQETLQPASFRFMELTPLYFFFYNADT